jgi:hypothetical protein
MIKNILLTLFLFFSMASYSQVTVYYSFDDFKNEKGEVFDDYKHYFMASAVTLTFVKNNKNHRVKCKKMWGFTYKDALFRVDEFNKVPARLMSHGKIFYYENGIAHLDMLKNNSQSGSSPSSFMVFFSKSLETPVVAFTSNKTMVARIPYQKFKKNYPEYKELYDCMNGDYYISNTRECVYSFQGKENEED